MFPEISGKMGHDSQIPILPAGASASMIESPAHSGKSILVTGGLGVMGRRLSLALAGRGHRTRVLCLPAETGSRVASDLSSQGIEIHPGDVTRPETLPAALAGIDTVFHLAAVLLSPLRPDVFHAVNAEGTRHLARAAEAAGVGHFIHVSSVSVLYSWTNDYARSKRLSEEIVRSSRLPATIIRPTLAYEDGGSAEFMRFVDHLKRFPVVLLPDGGRARKNPVHVEDLVQGFLSLVGCEPAKGKTYHFAGGGSLSLREMAEALLAHMGRPKPLLGVPLALAFLPAAAAWLYGRALRRPHAFTLQSLTGLCQDAAPEDEGAARDLLWRPRSFREGIATLRSLKGCLAV